jgi:hypothetical protein
MPESFITLFLGEFKVFFYSRTKTVLLKYANIVAGYIFSSPSRFCPRQLAQITPRVPVTDVSTRAPDKSVVWGQLSLLIPGIFIVECGRRIFRRSTLSAN